MSYSPKIHAGLFLERDDGKDFDQALVSQRLNLMPTRSQTASMLKNGTQMPAFWLYKTPHNESWGISHSLEQLTNVFADKIDALRTVCKEQSISAGIMVYVYAVWTYLPEMYIDEKYLRFWGDANVSIGFDFYLDEDDDEENGESEKLL